jgi:hypothetical protein
MFGSLWGCVCGDDFDYRHPRLDPLFLMVYGVGLNAVVVKYGRNPDVVLLAVTARTQKLSFVTKYSRKSQIQTPLNTLDL